MKLYLDTSTPQTILRLNEHEYHFDLGNQLAEKILKTVHDELQKLGADWSDLTEITFMAGPGSFTGLRIGAAIVNTLADQLNIPLYKSTGEKVPVILPDYGRAANITAPKK